MLNTLITQDVHFPTHLHHNGHFHFTLSLLVKTLPFVSAIISSECIYLCVEFWIQKFDVKTLLLFRSVTRTIAVSCVWIQWMTSRKVTGYLYECSMPVGRGQKCIISVSWKRDCYKKWTLALLLGLIQGLCTVYVTSCMLYYSESRIGSFLILSLLKSRIILHFHEYVNVVHPHSRSLV